MKTQVKEAIEKAGGAAAVASHFGISPVSVYEWIKRGLVPADRCPAIEKFSNGAARCEELNSDVDWPYLRATVSNQAPAPPPLIPAG
jgi:DNA-binding transcriptional regulator YdaS (Cro superfamily)